MSFGLFPLKPPAKAPIPESREPKSIRFTPTEWGAIEGEARARGIEPSRFCRQLALTGLSMVQAQAAFQAAGRGTA